MIQKNIFVVVEVSILVDAYKHYPFKFSFIYLFLNFLKNSTKDYSGYPSFSAAMSKASTLVAWVAALTFGVPNCLFRVGGPRFFFSTQIETVHIKQSMEGAAHSRVLMPMLWIGNVCFFLLKIGSAMKLCELENQGCEDFFYQKILIVSLLVFY